MAPPPRETGCTAVCKQFCPSNMLPREQNNGQPSMYRLHETSFDTAFTLSLITIAKGNLELPVT